MTIVHLEAVLHIDPDGWLNRWLGAHLMVGRGALASQANEYAAMPSLHVAWALWCAWALWAVRIGRPARAVAAGYAALTVIIAMATANHYFLDVVAGALTAATAAVFGILHGLRRSSRSAGPDPDPGGSDS